jgi:hypothetical protein
MTSQQEQLWQNIQDFQLDDPEVDFTFSERLARENGWTKVYTERVIIEYKKFIFLCCISSDGVTPSDPVDQAWHLHLTYTQSYWAGLCRNVLGQEIRHNPTRGGRAEAGKFNSYYTRTQQLYTQFFNIAPPVDIWQSNITRFTDINFQRVNMTRYWLLRKPGNGSRVAILLMLIIVVGLFIQASETAIAIGIMVAVIVIVVIAVYKNESGGSSNSGCSDNGCSGDDSVHHGGHSGHDGHGGDSGCSSGCSGCSASGCSGCGSH